MEMETGGESAGGDVLGGGDALVAVSESSTSPDVKNADKSESEKVITAGAGNSFEFQDILENDVVFKKLVTFLNFEDMKTLSTVSKAALQAVRETTEFSNRAQLKICKEVIKNKLLDESTYLWKHITLDLSIPVEVVDLVADVLEEAESVYLTLPEHAIEDHKVARYLEEVLRKTKKLKTLGMEAEIMNKILHDVFSDVVIQQVLSKIQWLEIRAFDKHTENRTQPYYLVGCSEDDDETPFQRNFLQLSMMSLNLKTFLFGKVLQVNGSESACVKFIPNIIECIKDTVEDLELHLHVWKFEEMKGIRCRNLKRLTLSASGGEMHASTVETFLKNQPPLEEVDISLSNGFPISILMMLQGMLMKMKKLHLKAKRFVGRCEPVDWQFLERMTELKDFAIRKPVGTDSTEAEYGYGEEFLIKLPPTTEKISLQGFQSFWREDRDAEDRNIGDLLARFENLKELNLLRSAGAVTDNGLQSLISNCRKLVSLTFSHCHEVTDYGISGVPPRDEKEEGEQKKTGVSLDELTGLVHLKIRSCPNVSHETLLNVAKFKSLRSFDYYRNVHLPKEYLYQIVRQNPCLESIGLNIVSYEHDEEYLNELKREVKNINSRVHFFELLEKADWEDDDSDSDASSFNDGDSDFSGGGYPANTGDLYGFDDYDEDYDDSPYDFDEDEDDEDL